MAYLKLRGYEWNLIRKMYAAILTSIETKEYLWEATLTEARNGNKEDASDIVEITTNQKGAPKTAHIQSGLEMALQQSKGRYTIIPQYV